MDYKNTLNLPQTDFPMKADLITRDPERLKAGDDASLPVPPPSQYRSTSELLTKKSCRDNLLP